MTITHDARYYSCGSSRPWPSGRSNSPCSSGHSKRGRNHGLGLSFPFRNDDRPVELVKVLIAKDRRADQSRARKLHDAPDSGVFSAQSNFDPTAHFHLHWQDSYITRRAVQARWVFLLELGKSVSPQEITMNFLSLWPRQYELPAWTKLLKTLV